MKITDSDPLFPVRKILVATDGSENANRAVEAAAALAKQFDCELVILNVIATMVPPVYFSRGFSFPADEYYSKYFEEAGKRAATLVNEAVKDTKLAGVNARGVYLRSTLSVAEAIMEYATKEDVSLIVVGTRGNGGFERLLLGSVSSAIVSHAHCAVLVVR